MAAYQRERIKESIHESRCLNPNPWQIYTKKHQESRTLGKLHGRPKLSDYPLVGQLTAHSGSLSEIRGKNAAPTESVSKG